MPHSPEKMPGSKEHASESPSRMALGKAGAWEHFYVFCTEIIIQSPAVRRLSPSDREDCIQDVMMELVRKFGDERPESIKDEHVGLIRTLSRNKAVDIMRRRYTRPAATFEDGTGSGLSAGEDSGITKVLSQGETVSIVWEALLKLDQEVSVTSYLVFYLRTIEGWEVEEIVDLFGMSADQVRSRCHRVKTLFGEALKRRAK